MFVEGKKETGRSEKRSVVIGLYENKVCKYKWEGCGRSGQTEVEVQD